MSTQGQPRIQVLRNPDWGYGVPLLSWLLRRKGWLVRLEEDWPFRVWDGARWRRFVIPRGFLFDMASIPAALWGPPFNYSPFGTYLAASLEHDFLCVIGNAHEKGTPDEWLRQAMGEDYPKEPVPSAWTHEHFARRIHDDGTRKSQAKTMAAMVRRFGPVW
jgi:hypothetical protein